MSDRKTVKVVFDTNIWISYLIGKYLGSLTKLIANNSLTLIFSYQLLDELETVTQKPKLRKYFPQQKVNELLELIKIVGRFYDVIPTHSLCRDPKDNFLLDLIDISNGDYLITGDKDLIELNPFKSTRILTPAEFEHELLLIRQ